MLQQPVVFLGDPVKDPAEARVLARLRSDLRSYAPCLVVANFIAPGSQQRQIDLLVLTSRLCHIELKVLDLALPVLGGANGPWRQQLPDGTERELGSNAYRQAHDGTYAISDVMRELARTGAVPAVPRFFTTIDTVVCLYPAVPAGSRFSPYAHVDVVGYTDLLLRLASECSRPPWDQSHWETFLRHLGVFQDDVGGNVVVEPARRESETALADYRRRFALDTSRGLHELVPIAGPSTDEPIDVIAHVNNSGTCVLLGGHGLGKTHTARHAAIQLAQSGHLVLWARCDEYDKGRFSALLARAAAPFSAESLSSLLAMAYTAGAPVSLVLDGYNECPPALRDELLEQASAFRLRYPGGTIITSTIAVTTPASMPAVTITVEPPDATDRAVILASYGARNPARISEAFRTPFELAVAAQCDEALPDAATATDLFDAYISRLTPAEASRAALRALATVMDNRLRTSLSLVDVRAVLAGSGGLELRPETIDEVLASPVLAIVQGRVRFTHELLGRFLAAEQLVLQMTTGETLGSELAVAHHADLRAYAIMLERDPQRRAGALSVVADATLYEAATRGDLGPDVQDQVRAAISRVLSEACAATSPDQTTLERADHGGLRWTISTTWSPAELAMFTAAGRLLRVGTFVDEITVLLDRTDALCARAIKQLADEGEPAPITAVVAATFTQSARRDAHGLPASVIAVSCDRHSSWRPDSRRDGGIAAMLASSTHTRSWGRLYVALSVADAADPRDAVVLPKLVRQAWEARGYHLQLQAIEVAHHSARPLDAHTRETVADLLETLTSSHLFLSSALVEALAAYGRVDPIATLDDLTAELRDLLERRHEPQAWERAYGFVASQFEDETIVGPYTDAIEGLSPSNRIRLFLMAARTRDGFWRSWTLARLVDAAPTGDRDLDAELEDVFRTEATTLETAGPMLQDSIAAHVEGLRGWARLSAVPLPTRSGTTADQRAWTAVDNLVLDVEGVPGVPRDAHWGVLLGELRRAAPDVLYRLQWGHAMTSAADVWHALRDRSAREVRELLEHALIHRESLTSLFPHVDRAGRARFIVQTLGEVGTSSTAALLRGHVTDPVLGSAAVAAIRRIEARFG